MKGYTVPAYNQHTCYLGDDYGGHNIPYPHPAPPTPNNFYDDCFVDLDGVYSNNDKDAIYAPAVAKKSEHRVHAVTPHRRERNLHAAAPARRQRNFHAKPEKRVHAPVVASEKRVYGAPAAYPEKRAYTPKRDYAPKAAPQKRAYAPVAAPEKRVYEPVTTYAAGRSLQDTHEPVYHSPSYDHVNDSKYVGNSVEDDLFSGKGSDATAKAFFGF